MTLLNIFRARENKICGLFLLCGPLLGKSSGPRKHASPVRTDVRAWGVERPSDGERVPQARQFRNPQGMRVRSLRVFFLSKRSLKREFPYGRDQDGTRHAMLSHGACCAWMDLGWRAVGWRGRSEAGEHQHGWSGAVPRACPVHLSIYAPHRHRNSTPSMMARVHI